MQSTLGGLTLETTKLHQAAEGADRKEHEVAETRVENVKDHERKERKRIEMKKEKKGKERKRLESF